MKRVELTLSRFQIARLNKNKAILVQKNGTQYEVSPRVPAIQRRLLAQARKYQQWLAQHERLLKGADGVGAPVKTRRYSKRVECPRCGKLVKRRGLTKHIAIAHDKKYVGNIHRFHNLKRLTGGFANTEKA